MSRYQMMGGPIPLTPVAKKLIIINVVIWFVFVLVIQNLFLNTPYIFYYFGLLPEKTIMSYWIWQPFTYMFVHSNSVFHILFNMLLLWWMGSDLEPRWGSKFFLSYYIICGVGAAIFYLLSVIIYYFVTGHMGLMTTPVVGASGAVFGLMLAFGMIFGERTVLFMMIFPMKAKYFVMLLGGIEVVTLINSGESNGVANLAHIGGLLTGYLYLKFGLRLNRPKAAYSVKRRKSSLRLVVDNEKENNDQNPPQGPKYWN